MLEAAGFNAAFHEPDKLPPSRKMDEVHRGWRERLIDAGTAINLPITHGVAAKLINCYLKSRFVCGGYHAHERIHDLHPPIDEILLKTLAEQNFGGHAKEWRSARNVRWSKFNSEQYEKVIRLIRKSLGDKPLWMIEEHWRGNQ